jgi:hypothetical protein
LLHNNQNSVSLLTLGKNTQLLHFCFWLLYNILLFWVERSRGGRSGPDYRDYRGGASASRGYSPVRGEGPPSKRIRPDWPLEERRYGGMPHDTYGSYGWAHDHFGPHPAHQGYGQPMPPVPAR